MSTALAQKVCRKSDILTDKERKFIIEYLIDSNGTRSVVEAGYKCTQPSSRAKEKEKE